MLQTLGMCMGPRKHKNLLSIAETTMEKRFNRMTPGELENYRNSAEMYSEIGEDARRGKSWKDGRGRC